MNIKDLTITYISCILYTFIPVGLWTNLQMLITLEYIPNLNQFWEMREHFLLEETPVAFDETRNTYP